MGCNSGTYAVHKGYIQGKLAVISQGLTGSTLTMHQRHLRWHIRGAHRQYKSSVHVSAPVTGLMASTAGKAAPPNTTAA